tara:strand:- start:123 stop:308 length:186 start_codon:yes stop_codon:yes gene_type:complete
MVKEKEVIMKVLQSYCLKHPQAKLISEFTRAELAEQIIEAQREVWNEVLLSNGIELVTKED